MSDLRIDPADPITIVASADGDACVLAVVGELDLTTSDVAEAAVLAAVEATDQVIVDLSEVDFADIRGIRALNTGVRVGRSQGARVTVRNCSRPVQRLLSVLPELGPQLRVPGV